jgi:hypothetical protein
MTSPQQPDWKRHFQNFRVKVEQPAQPQFIVWFNAIPSSGKLLAIVGGGILSLSLMKTVYQLVTSLISLSILGVILYLVYRFWILPKNSN